jgi:hypothetical protein
MTPYARTVAFNVQAVVRENRLFTFGTLLI